MQFTTEQVLALAPDEASAKAARGLVDPSKWPLLGASPAALWGECLGSGAKPYQVQMDVNGPTFRCSCPSRKFPCKHGIALLLLDGAHRDAFRASAPPAWVTEWLESRQERAEKKAQKQDEGSAPDPAAAARRDAKRLERMSAGAAELRRWLADHVAQGLAHLAGDGAAFEALAARMVDAQAPGLAFRVRRMQAALGTGARWPERLLAEMGRTQLLLDAFERMAALPPALQADVRAALGWPVDKDETLTSAERVVDAWFVLGQGHVESGKLWERRVWLQGLQSGRRALLLEFSHGSKSFEYAYATGTVVTMTLAFVGGGSPLRALIVDRPQPAQGAMPPATSLADALDWIGERLSASPWQSPWPLVANDGIVRTGERGWHLQRGDRALPLAATEDDGWQLVALGGGAATTLFGEWDGERVQPLSCWTDRLAWTRGDMVA